MPGLELALGVLSQPGLARPAAPVQGCTRRLAQAGTDCHHQGLAQRGTSTWEWAAWGIQGHQGEWAELLGPGNKGARGQLGNGRL